MVVNGMGFELICDSCEYVRTMEDEPGAYARARDHETDHPTHFVFITTTD